MSAYDDFFDKGTIAGLFALIGLGVGISLTTIIAKLFHDSEMDAEQKKRNLIAVNELTQNMGDKDQYNVIRTYETRLQSLYKTIQEQYGLDKRNEFETLINTYALPKKTNEENSKNEGMASIPDLSDGLIRRNWLKGSGSDMAIMEVFEAYKDAKNVQSKGMDVYMAMMQILQNIVIVYKEFLFDIKVLPDIVDASKTEEMKLGKLEAVNLAMTTFVKELENTSMFRDRAFKLIKLNETRRQMNLPKITNMITKMGEEAAAFQKKVTVVERSNEKFRKICNAASCFAQSLERMSEASMYALPRLEAYTLYKRKDGVIHYNIESRNDYLSASDDLVANIMIKHIRNAYSTFFSNHEKIGTSEFSYLNHLINATNENADLREEGKITLPSIAKLTIKNEKYKNALTEKSLRSLTPDIDKYFRYIFIAAAMQADLSMRINDSGHSQSAELEYRQKLINTFITHANRIAAKDILGEGSYFREFIERTNDADITRKALDEDDSVFNKFTKNVNINPADKDKLYGATPNNLFGISLNHMLHAEAMKKAADEFKDVENIDKHFSMLISTSDKNIKPSTASGFNDEFLYNLALTCQSDIELKTAILNIKSPNKGKKKLDRYIKNLDKLKQATKDVMENWQFNNIVESGDYSIIKHNDGTEYKVHCTLPPEFHCLMEGAGSVFFTRTKNGNYIAKELHFSNKENINQFKKNIEEFLVTFKDNFENDLLQEGYDKQSPKFMNTIVNKFNLLIKKIDEFNTKVTLDEASIERLARIRQKGEFEQIISQMSIANELRNKELANRIENYQGTQKKIIENLFSKNNQIFTDFIDVIKKYTDQYNTILTDTAIKFEGNLQSSFNTIVEGIKNLQTTQNSSYKLLTETLDTSDANNNLTERTLDLNEKLINHTDHLSTLLQQTIPDTITNILSSVNNTTMEMSKHYKEKIQQFTLDLEQARLQEAEFINHKIKTTDSMESLKTQLTDLESELSKTNSELASQKLGIQNVDRELKSLAELADRLSGVLEGDQYKNAKNKVEDGINRYLSKNIQSLDKEYAADSHKLDTEVSDILNNYHKMVSMVNLAEECSTTLRKKIDEIILLNINVNNHNNSASDSIHSISITVRKQKKSISDLESQITRLQTLYDAARSSHLNGLTNQIEMMKEQKKEMEAKNNELRSSQMKYEELIEKQISNLNVDLKVHKSENATLRNENAELATKNHNLHAKIESIQTNFDTRAEALLNIANTKSQELYDTTIAILSESANQFNSIQSDMLNQANTSFDNITQLQLESNNEIDSINLDLNQIRDDIGSTHDIFRSLNHHSTSNLNSKEKYSLEGFKRSCARLIDNMNQKHEKRLKNSNSGSKKLEWINTASGIFYQNDISNEEFLKSFKVVLIIYLQNRGFWNAKKTTMGRSLIDELNTPENRNLRELLFGKKDRITYEKLAGKLLNETDANNAASEIISADNNKKLTLNKFSYGKSSLTSLALEKTLEMEKAKKTYKNANDKLVQEKSTLEKKMDQIKKTTAEISNNISTKIKSLSSVSTRISTNPFSFSATNPFAAMDSRDEIKETSARMVVVK